MQKMLNYVCDNDDCRKVISLFALVIYTGRLDITDCDYFSFKGKHYCCLGCKVIVDLGVRKPTSGV